MSIPSSETDALPNRLLALLIIPVVVVAALGAGELLLRLLMPHAGYAPLDWYIVPHAALGQAMSPNAPGHDARGFRNVLVPEGASVLFLGDSQVHGYGVPVDKNFPHLVGRMRDETTYNVSLGGYSPPEYRYLYREVGRLMRPEQVVVAFSIGTDVSEAFAATERLEELGLAFDLPSDVEPRARQLRDAYSDITKRHRPLIGRIDRALRNVKLYSLVTRLADYYPTGRLEYYEEWEGELREARNHLDPDEQWLVEQGIWLPHRDEHFETIFMPLWRVLNLLTSAPDTRVGLDLCETALASMAADARADGAEMWLLLIPSKESIYHPYLDSVGAEIPRSFRTLESHTEIAWRAIASAMRRERIPIIDPTSALLERANAGELIYSDDHDGHLNELGHAIVARVVVDALEGAGETIAR